MDFWIKAAQLILSLSILVILHEFGHFIPARIFKTKVEKFYLFFNPWFSIVRANKRKGKWKFSWFSNSDKEKEKSIDSSDEEEKVVSVEQEGKTEWGIGWLPLGGYVKIAGMVDESMDTEQLAKPAQPWEFRSKPAWQRLIIMIGGVTVNLILGLIIYSCIMYAYGEEKLNPSNLKNGLAINPYFEKYDLHSGDNILSINGEKIENVTEINNMIMLRDAREIKVKRTDGKIETVHLPEGIEYDLFHHGAFPAVGLRHKSIIVDSVMPNTPALKAGLQSGDKIVKVNGEEIEYFDDIQKNLYKARGNKAELEVDRNGEKITLTSNVKAEGSIGFAIESSDFIDKNQVKHVYYGFGESISRGIDKGFHTLSDYTSQLKFLFTKKGASSIGGFGSIGNMFPAQWDWQIFWMNTAFISIVLAFMNILPIPALDGGHVVFLIYEMITGKEAPQKILEYAQYVGFFLLMSLVIYANGNDIYRWIFEH